MPGMSRRNVVLACAAVLLAAGVVGLFLVPSGKREGEILVLCGGSMRAAVEEITKAYEALSGDEVLMTIGGSGELCAQIKLTRKGDVFVCHDPFMEWAEKRGLIDRWETVGMLKVVIVVPKGNPKGVKGLEDLARPGVRVGIGDVVYSTSGVIANEMFKKAPFGEDVRRNVRLETKGHQKRATDVSLNLLDAAIVWDAVAFLFRDKLDVVRVDYEYVDAITSATYGRSDLRNVKVTAGITSFAKDREEVRRFWEYLTGDGRRVFREYGFSQPEQR